MIRPVITGLGCISPAGVGVAPLEKALSERRALGRPELIPGLRGRRREMRVARIAPFPRETYLPSRKLRRMGDLSQIWVIACLLARGDAGLDPADGWIAPPERRGTYLGTGYGCTETTWEYLRGLFTEGAGVANPFLFSESVANAPAGHSAIEMDTQGATVTFTCGDASAASAVEVAARAIREGRVAMAYCGGVEVMTEPLLRVLAGLGSPPFVGDGCVCLILESLDSARARGARIYAEVAGTGMGSDPNALATEWSRDPAPLSASMRRALGRAGGTPGTIFLHACGAPPAEEAERRAASSVCPDAPTVQTTRLFGSFAAAGGLNLAAGVLAARDAGLVLLNASSWGGGIVCLALRSVPPDQPGRFHLAER